MDNDDIEMEDNGDNLDMKLVSPKTPDYRRLTFISINACDFCTHVTNPGPYMYYISFETKNGWVSCGDE